MIDNAIEIERELALEAVELGEASLEQAERTLADCLANGHEVSDHEIYSALKLWTWRAVEAKRRDDQLPAWGQLIATVAAHFERRGSPLAAKVETLAEIIHPSIMLATADTLFDALRLKHVRAILKLVANSRGSISRRDLMAETKLKEANLTRVMGPLIDQGWFQRESYGREVIYRLTELGRDACRRAFPEQAQAGDAAGSSLGRERKRIRNKSDLVFRMRPSSLRKFGELTPAQIKATGAPNYRDGPGRSVVLNADAARDMRRREMVYPVRVELDLELAEATNG